MVPRARERSSCTMQLRYLLPLYQCTCSVPLYLQCTFTCICTCNCKCTCTNSSFTCTLPPRLKTYGSRWATSLPTEACSTQVKYVTSQTLNIDIKAPYLICLFIRTSNQFIHAIVYSITSLLETKNIL